MIALFLQGCVPVEDPPADPDPIDAVDPLIATGGPGFRVGSATPAATVPFGLVKVGPDTATSYGGLGAYHCSGYYHDDDRIQGFSHFHLHGVGVPDYGNILFMPTDGWTAAKRDEDGYEQVFSHDDERATAGAYAVTLQDGIEVELAATRHAAQHRYTFPETVAEPVVVIDLEHNLYGSSLGGEVDVDAARGVVSGWMINSGGFTGAGVKIYFYAVFDDGIDAFGTWADDDGQLDRDHATGVDLGAWIVPGSRTTDIRVGISLVSVAGARANLGSELGPRDISGTQADAAEEWEEALDGITVEGASDEERAIFYTSLYHLLQMPTEHGDADGTYVGFDGETHTAVGWTYHSDMSMWDTYRTAHPLYNLLYREKSVDFARSLLAMAKEGGAFPRWPAAGGEGGSMLGAPADIVLADTWMKGIRDWEMDEAWPLLREQANGRVKNQPYNSRPDVATLEAYGYYPSDWYGSSVAWLQEDAWADHALAQLAGALGESDDAAHFAWRSHMWRNTWDDEVGFFHGRLSDGTFYGDFDEFGWLDEYTEGNAWQYLWMPWFHPDELAETMGGQDGALAKLTTFFEEAEDEGVLDFPQTWYWHGNEPDIHAAWLFTLWGDRDATWRWVRWIAETHYAADPVGLAGNDDAGTLSAWYVFAALGFYPVAGTDRYVAGVPLFPETAIPLDGGTFTSRRVGEGDHVVSVTLDGVPVGETFPHSALEAGGVYEVVVE